MPKNIWAVGRNYSDHAKEMNAPVPKEPMVFLKSGSCLVHDRTVPLDTRLLPVHHELEIAYRLDDHLEPSEMALALDLTARTQQGHAKENGLPWTLAKSFRNSCPISHFVPVPKNLPVIAFELMVNGQVRQSARSTDMIFDVNVLLKHLISFFPVESGDIVLTGTPSGVGSVMPGDTLVGTARSDLGHSIRAEWVFFQA